MKVFLFTTRRLFLATVCLALVSTAATAQAEPDAPQASPQTQRASDQEIEASIAKALESDRVVLSPLIRVDVQDGVATLEGSTSTLLAKERALAIARKSADVTDVVDRIAVKPHVVYVDSELKKHVEQALQKDARLIEYTVDVRDGFVVLNGAAESEKSVKGAEQIIKGVVGVRGLENQLAVKPKPAQ